MDEHQDENPYGTTPAGPDAPTGSDRRRPPPAVRPAVGRRDPADPAAAPARGEVAVAGTLALAVGLGGVAIGQAIGNHTVTGSGTPAAGSSPIGQLGWGDQFGDGSGEDRQRQRQR